MMQLLGQEGSTPNTVTVRIANPDAELVKRAVRNLTDPSAVNQLTSPAKVCLEMTALMKQMAAKTIPGFKKVQYSFFSFSIIYLNTRKCDTIIICLF